MFALFDPALLALIERWDELKRWERRDVGQALRRLGFSYREIGSVIPVGKATLSLWCRDIVLSAAEQALLEQRQAALVRQGQIGRKRRYETTHRAAERRETARLEVPSLRDDPLWVAGTTAYWAEGGKAWRRLTFANSDPSMIRLFIVWASRYLDLSTDRFTISLHLHSGQEETERQTFWSNVTGIPTDRFRKTFVKPEGTGHRKKALYNGTAQVRVTKSAALLDRVLGWIEGLCDAYVPSR